MDEFGILVPVLVFEPLFQEIFYGFYVVVGGFLKLLDGAGILLAELGVNLPQPGVYGRIYVLELGQGHLAQGDKVFNFDPDPVVD